MPPPTTGLVLCHALQEMHSTEPNYPTRSRILASSRYRYAWPRIAFDWNSVLQSLQARGWCPLDKGCGRVSNSNSGVHVLGDYRPSLSSSEPLNLEETQGSEADGSLTLQRAAWEALGEQNRPQQVQKSLATPDLIHAQLCCSARFPRWPSSQTVEQLGDEADSLVQRMLGRNISLNYVRLQTPKYSQYNCIGLAASVWGLDRLDTRLTVSTVSHVK